MVAFEHRADNNLAILETNGYYLYFCFDFSENIGNNLVSTEISFLTKPEISQEVCVKSERFKMNFNDIKRLSNYFKNHIKTLKTNVNSESHTFVDYSLTYQIQALCGFVSSDKNVSYFTISSMVNVGKTNTSNFSTYIGGESTISFNQVENFINSLEDVISYRLCKLDNRDNTTIIDKDSFNRKEKFCN